MEVRYYDPSIDRKSRLIDSLLDDRQGKCYPAVVEISGSGACNRVCEFCPRSDPSYPHDESMISDNIIDSITQSLSRIDYAGLVIFSGFSEPLLDKKLELKLKKIKAKLPNCKVEVVTNGDPLSVKRLRSLFKAGLDTLLISLYDSASQQDDFIAMAQEADVDSGKIILRPRYLPEDMDFGITLNNRSGAAESAKFSIKKLTESLDRPCNYPFYTIFVDYDGAVLLCPHDWGKKFQAGNLQVDDLLDVWFGDRFEFARNKLAQGDRRFSPCSGCDVNGTLIGEKHRQHFLNKSSEAG